AERRHDDAEQDRESRGRVAVLGDLLQVMLLGDELVDDRSHFRTASLLRLSPEAQRPNPDRTRERGAPAHAERPARARAGAPASLPPRRATGGSARRRAPTPMPTARRRAPPRT